MKIHFTDTILGSCIQQKFKAQNKNQHKYHKTGPMITPNQERKEKITSKVISEQLLTVAGSLLLELEISLVS